MTELFTTVEPGWKFDNSYARLPQSFYTYINPAPVSAPKLVALNDSLANCLGLDPKALQSKAGVEVFAGNRIPKGALPLAQAYAGHQFGHFTILGDGRAILLGEQITLLGKRFDIQLKGSGKTPYSRGGDGRAALGPMLREFIISEAMYGLGIPTTRSLAVVTTGEPVFRETKLKGAILTRVAASHIRVGTFQYVSRFLSKEELKNLADYTIKRHFINASKSNHPYLSLLREVVKVQASLIAKWQLVGFVHGVMNTDNMAISGETIDYGPCAFMDTYDSKTVFSSIDTYGRYAYGNQPDIALWNLARFAETLLPLINDDEKKAISLIEEELSNFKTLYFNKWIKGMKAKLGIINEEPEDESLISDLLNIMHKHKGDYTNTFIALTFGKFDDEALFKADDFIHWYNRWQVRLSKQQETKEFSQKMMKDNNPSIIPRNHRVEEALEAAVKNEDYSVMNKFLKVLSKPYAHSSEQVEYKKLTQFSNCPYKTFCGT